MSSCSTTEIIEMEIDLLSIECETLDTWRQCDDVGRPEFLHEQGLFAKVVAFLQRPDLLLFHFT